MKSLWLKVTPLLICLLLASGCSTPLNLSNVPITITEYTRTATDTKARLKLNISNENIFSVAIASITGKLYLNGTYIGKFEITKPMGIQRLGTSALEAELIIEKTDIVQKLRASSAPSIAYRLECKLHLELSEERSNSSTVSEGQIDTASLRAEPSK